jgi:hypothetical protein
VDRPLPWLKYVDAGDLDDGRVDFDSMDIESPTGEHLGDVDGFVVDASSGRPYYIVVDAGGWFKSKEYLLPVGHAALDADRQVLVTSLGREHVDRFPGFDKDAFEKLSEVDIQRFNNDTCVAIAGEAIIFPAVEPMTAAWDRSAYRYPDWWHAEPTVGVQVGERAGATAAAAVKPTPADLTRPVGRSEPAAAEVVAAEQASVVKPVVDGREPVLSGARTTSRDTGSSPHFDGRAQPGDVLGIETGGETTEIGDTSDTENARRRDAEKGS